MDEQLFQEGMELIEQAKQLQADGDAGGAEALLARAVVWNEPSIPPIAGVELGMLYERQGKDDAAMHFYKTTVSTGYTLAGAMAASNLGDLHMRHGRAGDAKEAWEASIKLAGDEHKPITDDARQKLAALQSDVPPPQV